MRDTYAASDDRPHEVDQALARGVLYDVLTRGFRCPTVETGRALTSADAIATLAAAATVVDGPSSAEPLLPAVKRLAALSRLSAGEISDSYHRLFGHTVRGVICPFETEYGGSDNAFRQPQELADIAGYYLAFGLRPRTKVDERVDHIGCECEFMGFLSRKEALALELADESNVGNSAEHAETLEETRRTARQFLRNHLGRFGLAFGARLTNADPDGLYGHLGEILFRFIGIECERWHVSVGSATLELRSTQESQAPMACGPAPEAGETRPELIQLQR